MQLICNDADTDVADDNDEIDADAYAVDDNDADTNDDDVAMMLMLISSRFEQMCQITILTVHKWHKDLPKIGK